MDVLGWVALAAAVAALAIAGIVFKKYTQALARQTEAEKQHALAGQRCQSLESALAAREQANAALAQEKEALLVAKKEMEKTVALKEQAVTEMQLRMKDWEKTREEMTQAARSSLLSAGSEMSNKLLADHKREQEAAKKQHEAIAQKNTDAFLEQFNHVTSSVAALKSHREQDAQTLATVWRSLSTPAGAGQLAEVGLENALKNLALEPGRDFIMQYSMPGHEAGSRLRPDCLVFLNQKHVMVIDSKASKFVLELAQSEHDPALHKEALANFARSMNEHLRALSSKDYEGAVRQMYQAGGRTGEIEHIHSVMYVPNENAYAYIRKADPEFESKVQQKRLILASPVHLSGLLSLAMTQIIQARQAENQKEINEAIQVLLDGMAAMFTHVKSVGDGIRNAAESFSAFAGSANRFVLPRVRKLHKLGIRHNKQEKLPVHIAGYTVNRNDDALTIEADDTAAGTLRILEKPEVA